MPRRTCLFLAALACGDPPPPDDPVDSEPTDSPVDDSDPPPVRPAQPPADWGPGLVDLSAPWLGSDAFPVEDGDAAAFRGPQVAPGVFAQLDADPAIEVIVGASRLVWPGVATHVRVYDYDLATGALTRRPDEEARHTGPDRDVPYGALDLDGDGLTDLLGADGEALLRYGRGDGTFETGPSAGIPPELSLLTIEASVYPMDIDRDGWLDLLAGDASCGAGLMPFARTGPRMYRWRPEWVEETTGPVQVASIVAMPWPGGGELVVTQGNPCDLADPHPGLYLRRPDTPGEPPRWVATDLTPTPASWQEVPEWFGLPWTAVAPMGAGVNDYDGDGLFDLTLVLGMTYLGVLQATPDGQFVDQSRRLAIPAGRVGPAYPYVEFAWSVAHPDLDLDGRQDLLLTIGDDFTSFTQLHKDMQQQIYWNGGAWRFQDVTVATGLPIAGSFHGLFTDDLDSDGDIDLLYGGYGDPPRLIRNDIDVGRRGLVVKLRGTTSNHLGVGALVAASADGVPARTVWMGDAGNMDSRGAPLAHFGLGEADAADEIRVVWPSGVVQVLRDVPAGVVVIEEPPTLTVRSATRRAPADGATELELVATPRGPDGARRDDVVVTWQTFGTPAAQRTWTDADGVHLALTSDVEGSTVVEVRLDGVPVEIRPRLWWGGEP